MLTRNKVEIEETADLDKLNDLPVEVQVYISMPIFERLVQWRILAECWHHAKAGRGKRSYLKEFNEAERKTLSWYHKKFHDWLLVTGPPSHKMRLRTEHLHLLQRAVALFAAI